MVFASIDYPSPSIAWSAACHLGDFSLCLAVIPHDSRSQIVARSLHCYQFWPQDNSTACYSEHEIIERVGENDCVLRLLNLPNWLLELHTIE